MLKDVASYIKNLGKSVVYSTVDVVAENTEFSAGFASTNKELLTEAYHAVKDYKNTITRVKGYVRGTKVWEAGDAGVRSLFEDLKTGKWYNKEREAEFALKYSGELGNFDEFDDMSVDSDDLESARITAGDKSVVSAVQTSSRQSAEMISETVARSGKMIMDTNKAGTQALYQMNVSMLGGLKGSVDLMNSNLSKGMGVLGESFTTHASNSKTYYEVTTKLMQEQNAMFKELLDMQRELYKGKQEAQNANKRPGISDIAIGGIPDLAKYGQNIKRNALDMASGTGLDMLLGDTLGEGSNLLATFMASPLKFLPQFMVRSIIPNTLKTTARQFDKTLSGVFGTMIGRMNKWANGNEDNPLLEKIGRLFGIRVDNKTTINTAKYNKGPVPWDGVAKKALVEVIPGYLSRIESLLSRQPERLYDYGGGKWTDHATLQAQWQAQETSSIMSAFSELKQDIMPMINRVSYDNKEQQDQFLKEVDAMLKHMYDEYGVHNFNTRPNASSEYADVSDQTYRIVANALKHGDRGTRINLPKNVMEAMENQANWVRNLEENLNQFYTLFDNSKAVSHITTNEETNISKLKTPTGLLTQDKNGRDVFFYLNNMLSEIQYIRSNGVGSDTGGQLVFGNFGGGSPTPPPNPNQPNGDEQVPPPVPQDRHHQMPSFRAGDFRDPTYRSPKDAYDRRKEASEKSFASWVQNKVQSNKITLLTGGYSEEDANIDYEAMEMAYERYQLEKELKQQKELREAKEHNIIQKWLVSEKEREAQSDRKEEISTPDGKKPSIFDELLAAPTLIDKFNVVRAGLEDIAKMPTTALEHILAAADKKIYEFIYGVDTHEVDEEGKPIFGFMNMMLYDVKNSFTKLNDWISEDIIQPLKEKLGITSAKDTVNKVLSIFGTDVDSIKGGIKDFLSPLKQEIQDTFGGAGDYIRDSVTGAFSPLIERVTGSTPLTAQQSRINKYTDYYNNVLKDPTRIDKKRQAAIERYQSEITERYRLSGVPETELFTDEMQQRIKVAAEKRAGRYFKSGRFDEDNQFDILTQLKQSVKNRDLSAFAKEQGLSFSSYNKESEARKKAEERRNLRYQHRLEAFINRNTTESDEGEPVPDEDIQSNAKGTLYVEKGGITAISPGELIIPSELNPFNPDRGKVDKNKELADEDKAKKSFANSIASMVSNRASGTDDISKKRKPYTGILTEIGDDLKLTIPAFLEGIGLVKKDDKENILSTARNAVAKFTEIGPHAIATGLLGGTVGIFSGIVGGPILGAAIGAATGIVQRSETLQKALFGEKVVEADGTESVSGGLISKEIYDATKKYLPSMSKYGIAGAVAGLLTPFGPIGGMLIGSAIGFSKKNDKLSEALFGDEDGLLNKNRRDFISKAFPRMALGAAASMLLGPFGLFGNVILGSGVGLATSTTRFSEFMFGKEDEDGKRDGGLVKEIREHVVVPLQRFGSTFVDKMTDFIKNDMIKPVADAITPISRELAHTAKSALMFIPNILGKMFEDTIGTPIGIFMKEKFLDPMAKMAKGFLKMIITPVKAIASAPFKLIGGIGNMYKQNQIMQGRADYMTASERNQFRDDHKVRGALAKLRLIPGVTGILPGIFTSDKFAEDDKMLESMDYEQLKKAQTAVNALDKHGEKRLNREIQDSGREVFDAVNTKFKDKVIGGSRKQIIKAIEKGNFARATKLVATLKGKDGKRLSEKERQELTDMIMEAANKRQELIDQRDSLRAALPTAERDLEALGFTNFSSKNIGKYRAMIDTEVKAKKPGSKKEDDDPKKVAQGMLHEVAQSQTDRIVEVLQNIASIAEAIHTGVEIQVAANGGEEAEFVSEKLKSQREKANKRAEKASNKIHHDFEYKLADRSELFRKFYSQEQLDQVGDKIADNDRFYETLMHAAEKGHAFRDLEGLDKVLTGDAVDRVARLSDYTEVPKDSIPYIASLTEDEFANILAFAKQGYDFFEDPDEEGNRTNFSKKKVKDIAKLRTNWQYRDESKYKKGIFGMAQRAGDVLKRATPRVQKSQAEWVMEFEKAGLLVDDLLTPNDILGMSDREKQIILDNPEAYIRRRKSQEGDDEDLKTYSPIGRVLHKAGKMVKGGISRFGNFIDNGKEATEEKQEEKENDRKKNKFFETVAVIGDNVKDILGIQKKEATEEEPWWKKLLKGLKFALLGSTALGALPIMNDLLKTKIAPWFEKNVWEDKLEPVWNDTIRPFYIEYIRDPIMDKFGKLYTYFTEEFPKKIGEGAGMVVDWLGGTGQFDGRGLPMVFNKYLAPALGWVQEAVTQKLVPGIVYGLTAGLPAILGAVVKGLGAILSSSFKIFNHKVPVAKDDGSQALNSVATTAAANAKVIEDSKIFGDEYKPTGINAFRTGFASTYSGVSNINEMADATFTDSASSSDGSIATSWADTLNESTNRATGGTKNGMFAVDGEETFGESITKGLGRSFLRGNSGSAVFKAIADKDAWKLGKGAYKLLSNIPLANMVLKPLGWGTTGIAKGAGLVGQAGEKLMPTIAKKAGRVAVAPVKGIVDKLGSTKIGTSLTEKLGTKLYSNMMMSTANGIGGEALEEVAKEAGEAAAKESLKDGAFKGILTFIEDALNHFLKGRTFTKAVSEAVGSTKAVQLISRHIPGFIKTIMGKVGAGLKTAGKKVLTKLGISASTGGVATAVFMGADFISGMTNAKSILGVTDEVSLPERLVCGLLKALNGNLLLGIIPEDVLVNIFLDFLAPMLGMDVSEIQKRRQAALDEVAAYNEEHGTEFETVAEYNKRNSIGTKISNWWKGTVTDEYGKVIEQKDGNAIQRAGGAIKNAAVAVGSGVKNWAVDNVNEVKEWAGGIGSSIKKLWFGEGEEADMKKPANTGKYDDKKTIAKDGLFGVMKGGLDSAAIGLKNMGSSVADVFGKTKDKLKESFSKVGSSIMGFFEARNKNIEMREALDEQAISGAKSGSLSLTQYFKSGYENVELGPVTIGNMLSSFFYRVGGLPGIAISKAMSWLTSPPKTKEGHEEDDKLAQDVIDGKIGIWDYFKTSSISEDKAEEDGSFSPITKFMNLGYKLGRLPEILIKSLFTRLTDTFSGIIDWIKDKAGKIVSFFHLDKVFDFGAATKDTETSTGTGKIKVESYDAPSTGMGKHLYQRDPAFNMQFNKPGDTIKQTMADSGCGPVAAAQVAQEYNLPLSPKAAAKYAIQKGYKETDGGTYPSYFNSVLSNYGIGARQTNSVDAVKSNLKSGRPVILMGHDPKGGGLTPFASSPHYVVGTGLDRHGNIIVQDPDSRRGNQLYPFNKVMSKASTKLLTSVGNTGKGRKYISGKAGRGKMSGKGGFPDIAFQDLAHFTPMNKQEILAFLARFPARNRPENAPNYFSLYPEAFIEAAKQSHLDPRYIIAHSGLESGWGALHHGDKYNYFGIGVWDIDPNMGTSMANMYNIGKDASGNYTGVYANPECRGIIFGAMWIKEHFYDKGFHCLYDYIHKEKNHAYAMGGDNWILNICAIMAKASASSPTAISYVNIDYKPVRVNVDDIDPEQALSRYEYEGGFANPNDQCWDMSANNNKGAMVAPPGVANTIKSEAPDNVSGVDVSPAEDVFGNTTDETLPPFTNEDGTKKTFWEALAEVASKTVRALFGDSLVDFFGGDSSSSSDSSTTDRPGPANTGAYPTQPSELFIDSNGQMAPPVGDKDLVNYMLKTMGNGTRLNTNYPYSNGHDGNHRHTGVDFIASVGTPVYSPVDGVVGNVYTTPSGNTWNSGRESYGIHVYVCDKNGKWHCFAHLSKIASGIAPNKQIKRGDLIGYSGNSGYSSGPHLHYEVRNANKYLTDFNPAEYYKYADIEKTISSSTHSTVSKDLVNEVAASANAGMGKRRELQIVTPPVYNADEEIRKDVSGVTSHRMAAGGGPTEPVDYTKLILSILQALNIIAGNTKDISDIKSLLSSVGSKSTATSGAGRGKDLDDSASNAALNGLKASLVNQLMNSASSGAGRGKAYSDIVGDEETNKLMGLLLQLASE